MGGLSCPIHRALCALVRSVLPPSLTGRVSITVAAGTAMPIVKERFVVLLPPYSGDSPVCRACAYTEASTAYRAAPERLERLCARCGYCWDEALADFAEDASSSYMFDKFHVESSRAGDQAIMKVVHISSGREASDYCDANNIVAVLDDLKRRTAVPRK